MNEAATTAPWRVGDLASLVLAFFAAGVLLVVGWYLVSGAGTLSRQVTGLNVAVAGIVTEGVGIALWLMTVLRALGERRMSVLTRLPEPAMSPYAANASVAVVDADGLVAGSRMTRYHRSSCSLVVGKPVVTAAEEEHQAAGRRPCGICLP